MKKILFASILSYVSCVSYSSFAAEPELVAESARGRWTFSAGPSWRSRVTIDTSGSLFAPAATPRSTTKRDMTKSENWTDPKLVPDPQAGKGGIPAGSQLWGVSDRRTEVYGTAGSDYSLNASEDDRPIGLNLQGCYDFIQRETWSLGLNIRFAGYWNMESSTRGYYDAGSTRTETWRDDYIFPEESPDAPFNPHPTWATIEANGTTREKSVSDSRGSHTVSTRVRSDLYQIGLGPKMTWSPFEGWCRSLSWIDVYGGVEVLCNITRSSFDANGVSSSETDCRVGVGADVGLAGNLTDWLAIYGQIGYEWVDKTSVTAGSFHADIDYSSLVLSAGVLFRF